MKVSFVMVLTTVTLGIILWSLGFTVALFPTVGAQSLSSTYLPLVMKNYPGPTPTPAYEYHVANVACYHSGDKFIEGTVWESGAPKNGVTVRLSWAPDASAAADYVTGTDPGRPGYYLHPRPKGETGTYYVWVVDATSTRISDIGMIQFNNEGPDSPTACWRGVVDFVRNL